MFMQKIGRQNQKMPLDKFIEIKDLFNDGAVIKVTYP